MTRKYRRPMKPETQLVLFFGTGAVVVVGLIILHLYLFGTVLP